MPTRGRFNLIRGYIAGQGKEEMQRGNRVRLDATKIKLL